MRHQIDRDFLEFFIHGTFSDKYSKERIRLTIFWENTFDSNSELAFRERWCHIDKQEHVLKRETSENSETWKSNGRLIGDPAGQWQIDLPLVCFTSEEPWRQSRSTVCKIFIKPILLSRIASEVGWDRKSVNQRRFTTEWKAKLTMSWKIFPFEQLHTNIRNQGLGYIRRMA